MNISSSKKVVLGIDIGTTNVRCYAYDNKAKIIGKALQRIPILNLDDDRQEIEPEKLWEVFLNVIKLCLLNSNIKVKDVSCLGISTLRGTFVNWDKRSGETLHNFITWKDKRASDYCNMWNSSVIIKLLRFGSYIMSFITQKERFQLLSNLQFSTSMVLVRLYWIFQNKLKDKILYKHILFGTIETWLIWKLTGGKVHATDASNACATGFFDPFKMQWAIWILWMFNIPSSILPVVKKTCDLYGETEPELFGVPIPINAVIGDQQASLFGAGCFEKHDINCTMGTGTFLTVNTGSSASNTSSGLYPLVGWTIGSKTTYVAEGGVHDVGTIISWAKEINLFRNPADSENIASTVDGNGAVYFLPGAVSSQVMKDNNKLFHTSSFIGLTTNTQKAHMVRAILEAIAFQVCELYRIVDENYDISEGSLFRICGGVSSNNFILQLISNVTKRTINKLENAECSSLGAALLAGLYCGIWKDLDEIRLLIKESKMFHPNFNGVHKYEEEFLTWKKIYNNPIITKQV